MPAGRPTKYRKKFCKEIIEYGKQGLSKAEVCCKFGITRETLLQWANPKAPQFQKEFLDALKQYEQELCAWWEAQAKAHLSDMREKGGAGRHTNTNLMIFMMSNQLRNDYKRNPDNVDQQKQSAPNININISRDKLDDENKDSQHA